MRLQTLLQETIVADNDALHAFEEVRNVPRRSIYREAFLHLPEGVRVPAVALDISPLGARVRLGHRGRLPEFVEVTVLDEVKRQRARVAWASGADFGLDFINPELSAEAYLDNLVIFSERK